jgi:hypothetical protein
MMKRKNFLRTIGTGLAVGLLSPDLAFARPPYREHRMPQRRIRDFSCMWWEDGVRSPIKVFNILSGYYGLAFDYEKLSLTRLGFAGDTINERDVLTNGDSIITALDEIKMEAFTEKQGQHILLKGTGDIEDCQLVESGTYFQRRWMPSLDFDTHGLPADKLQSGLELSAWPSDFIFSIRVSPTIQWNDAAIGMSYIFPNECSVKQSADQTVSCTYASGKGFILSSPTPSHEWTLEGNKLTITLKKQEWAANKPTTLSLIFQAMENMRLPVSSAVTSLLSVRAKRVSPEPKQLTVTYDPVCGWHLVNLEEPSGSFNATAAFEKTLISIKNNSSIPQTLQLNFSKQGKVNGVPGLCSVLCDENDLPLGLPVQVSKDWHDNPARFNGQWYHGICVIHLEAGEERSLIHHTVYAFRNALPAVSMAQLSLVGWGKNQLWLQAAIGSWGESITFEPDQTHGRGLVLDCRPLAVWGMGKKREVKWNWTHNVGGADLLVYYDEENKKQWPSRAKTQITRYGPLFSEVAVNTETDNRKINLQYTLSLYGTDDYVRGIYRFRIDVKKKLFFNRFVIFQCGSDEYNYTTEKKMAIGNENGLTREWDTQWGGNTYRTDPLPLTGHTPWISLHNAVKLAKEEGAVANRGVILRHWKAMINGEPALPHAAERGALVSGENTSLIDILLSPGIHELQPGDFIEGQIEHIIMPQYADDYFGTNKNLAIALQHSADTWKMIHRDAVLNTPATEVKGGSLLSSWPIKIAFENKPLKIDITGGLAYQPMTITGIEAHHSFILEEYRNGAWMNAAKGHAWQTDVDATTGKLEITYNLFLDQPGEISISRKFRFITKQNNV